MATRDPRIRKVPSDIPGRLSGRHQATGGGAAGTFPGIAPGAGRPMAQPSSLDVPVPWLVRPFGAREINVNASGTGFTNLNTPAVIAGSVFVVPPDNVGVLRSLVLSVNNLLTTSALSWTLRFNGAPVEGWNGLTIFPRAAGSVSDAYGPDETFIMIPEQTTIDVQVIVGAADPATYQAGVTYHGWSYPKRLADKFANIYQF